MLITSYILYASDLLHPHESGHHASAGGSGFPKQRHALFLHPTDGIDRNRTLTAGLFHESKSSSDQSRFAIGLEDGSQDDSRSATGHGLLHISHTVAGHTVHYSTAVSVLQSLFLNFRKFFHENHEKRPYPYGYGLMCVIP